jgi:ABC-type nitrate/sulfonate/bicarbonate transport system substrate-binding protein
LIRHRHPQASGKNHHRNIFDFDNGESTMSDKHYNFKRAAIRIGPACYHALHMTVLMVAHEMNFFFDEGLQDDAGREHYELVPDGLAPFGFERTTLAQAMKDKEVHIATDVQPRTALYLSGQGEDCCVIAGWRNNRGRTLVAKREIQSLTGLRGKRIGISDVGDNHQLLLIYWLQQAGLDPETDVQWVTGIGPESRLRGLTEGRIDAGLVTHGGDHIVELQRAGLSVLQDFSSAYPNGRPDRVIVSSNRVLEERRDDVKAFLRAILRTYWFVRDVRNFFYFQNLEKRLRRQSPNRFEQTRPVHAKSLEWMEKHQAYPVDGLATGLEEYAKEMISLGDIKQVDLDKILRQDLMREAFQELSAREDVRPDLERAREVATRLGY